MTYRPPIYPGRIRAIDGNYFLSADYILRTGHGDGDTRLPGHLDSMTTRAERGIDRLLPVRGGVNALSVDLGGESELTTLFNAVCQNAMERMRASPLVRELLARPAWDRAGREL